MERNIKNYCNGRIEGNGIFRGIHLTNGICDPSITVSSEPKLGNVRMVVKRPLLLGDTNNQFDELIINAADDFGVPPQLIKAMIRQESNFDPNAERYEPFFDRRYIQNNQSLINSQYWLATGDSIYDTFNAHRARYPQRLWPRRIRIRYNRLLNSRGRTAAESYLRNFLNYGRTDGSNPPDGTLTDIAQTRIATSYGLLQVMYTTALERGFSANRPPEDLRDPETSINFGAGYLSRIFDDSGNWDEDWNRALNRYNGGGRPAYATEVRSRVNNYLPQPIY